MSQALQALLGAAMIDGRLRELLLNGGRQELLPKFALTDEEHRFLLDVKADSLEGFAAAVDQWLNDKSHRPLWPGSDTDTSLDFLR